MLPARDRDGPSTCFARRARHMRFDPPITPTRSNRRTDDPVPSLRNASRRSTGRERCPTVASTPLLPPSQGRTKGGIRYAVSKIAVGFDAELCGMEMFADRTTGPSRAGVSVSPAVATRVRLTIRHSSPSSASGRLGRTATSDSVTVTGSPRRSRVPTAREATTCQAPREARQSRLVRGSSLQGILHGSRVPRSVPARTARNHRD